MDIFSLIKTLNFPADKYVIIGGAAMAGRGIKETSDIDVLCSGDLLDELKEKTEWHYHPRIIPTEPAGLINSDRTIELYPTVGGTEIGFREVRNDAEIINGIPFASLEHVILVKNIYHRDKDIKDIALIKHFLDKKK